MTNENINFSLEEMLLNLKNVDNSHLPYEVISIIFENKEQIKNLDKKLLLCFPEIRAILDDDNDLCRNAVSLNSLNLLRVAHENNVSWDEGITTTTAYMGYFDCLKYAVENGCPVDPCYLYSDALKGGNRDCFKYVAKIHELKHELNENYEVVEYE